MADNTNGRAAVASAPNIQIPPTGAADSVVRPFDARNGAYGGPGNLVLMLAQEADSIPAWGTQIITRDRMLREFWPTEPYFAGALSSMVKKYVSLKFKLDGPQRMTSIVRRLMHNWEHGKGIKAFWTKIVLDVNTQSNGGFAEIVRVEDGVTSPVLQLNHLDAGRCRRTGDWDQPVLYWDRVGVPHLLNWYQVLTFEDVESPIEAARGISYSTLDRTLRWCQVAKDYSLYMKEKMGGRWNRAIHIVNGVSQNDINNALNMSEEQADGQLLVRYKLPFILTTLDPTTPLSHEQIDLAALPENFNLEEHNKWYFALLALEFGVDYTEFAPMPGGHLGSGQQSQLLAQKARGKGPAYWMSDVEQKMNFHGIMPPNVSYIFEEQDDVEETQRIMMQWRLAQIMNLLVDPKSGEPVITPEVARQILINEGFLDPEYLKLFGEQQLKSPAVQGFQKQEDDAWEPEDGPKISREDYHGLSRTVKARLENLGLEGWAERQSRG